MIIYLITILSFSISAKQLSVQIDQLTPTQFSIGKSESLKKVRKIEKLYSKGKLLKYLEKKIAPAIKGPGGKLWIIDRHHTSYAILNSNIPNHSKRLHIEVLYDWSHLNAQDFQRKMIEANYVYLKDNNFKTITFAELPKEIKNLRDNPLRSVASQAQEKGCFKKVSTPFLEFYWAQYFYEMGIANSESTLTEALSLCHTEQASHLPGYIK